MRKSQRASVLMTAGLMPFSAADSLCAWPNVSP